MRAKEEKLETFILILVCNLVKKEHEFNKDDYKIKTAAARQS